jgi:hypothetical protein
MKILKDGKLTFVAASSEEGKKELAKRKAEAEKSKVVKK